MKTELIKTIDVTCYEWFDRVNGNSYFSARVCINYGMDNEAWFSIPFQYGYDEKYKYETGKYIFTDFKDTSLWRKCKEHNIILRTYKKEVLKKTAIFEGNLESYNIEYYANN